MQHSHNRLGERVWEVWEKLRVKGQGDPQGSRDLAGSNRPCIHVQHGRIGLCVQFWEFLGFLWVKGQGDPRGSR